jgi:hypothetical protein
MKESPALKATEKVVEGKYVVSTYRPPGVPTDLIMAVTYDKTLKVYKKWVLLPNNVVAESIGLRVPGKRMIKWTSQPRPGELEVHGVETHTDQETKFEEETKLNGKVVWLLEGTAKVIK